MVPQAADRRTLNRREAFLTQKDALLARFPLSLFVAGLLMCAIIVSAETAYDGFGQQQHKGMLAQGCLILLINSSVI